jgi:hypothetical protein
MLAADSHKNVGLRKSNMTERKVFKKQFIPTATLPIPRSFFWSLDGFSDEMIFLPINQRPIVTSFSNSASHPIPPRFRFVQPPFPFQMSRDMILRALVA